MSKSNSSVISVVIPAYNYGQFLAECLESVLAQTYQHWECIIIDNGSTDNTRQVAARFTEKDVRFRYYFTEQIGVSAARNRAVELSRGLYILPLDADDKIANTYLEKAVALLQKRKELKVVYCEARLFGASSGKWQLPDFSFKQLLMENVIFCTALFRKEDFQKIGGFNTAMKKGFEDWDFWISLLKDGGEVYRIPEELFFYRIKEGSRNSVLNRDAQLELRRQIYQHHREAYLQYVEIPELIYDLHSTRAELMAVKRSRVFRLVNWIMAPLRWLQKHQNS